MRSVAEQIKKYISDNQVIISVTKGTEPDTLMTMSEVITDELKKQGKMNPVFALSESTHSGGSCERPTDNDCCCA